ncbi:MAG TPA: hypothetical protein VGM90_05160 [Kofleriaceae bacterium]
MDDLKRLRAITGAPLVECRAALAAASGDERSARARLKDIAIERIVVAAGCAKEYAEAAYVRFGWDMTRASAEARGTMLAADPVLAAKSRREWQLDQLRAATCSARLMPLVYEANLRTPLAEWIGAVAEIERLLEDRTGTDLGHVFDDARDWITAVLARLESIETIHAIQLAKLVRTGARDSIGRISFDPSVADTCLARLYERLREQLVRALDLHE